jgi:hypothetical protein
VNTYPDTKLSGAIGAHPRWHQITFIVLLVLQFCFSALLALLVLLFQFAFDSCDGKTCNYGLGGVSMWTGWMGILVAFVATVVVGLVLRRRGQAIWWFPLAGSGLALAFTTLSYYLTLRATGLTHL